MDNKEDSLFGDLVYKYTRAMALHDGVLVHVENRVYKYHTALTDTVFNHVGPDKMIAFIAASALNQYHSWTEGGLFKFENENYKVLCGPGDDPTPCITIMFEHED